MGKILGKKTTCHSYPLRKIMRVLRYAQDPYDHDYVELACGHRTRSYGMYQARCHQCVPKELRGEK